MLADNLRKTKTGPQRIASGEFIILESQTKRRIDLSRDWDSCFLPGQRVEMSMAFQRPAIESDACPGCKANPRLLQTGPGPFDEDENVECDVCGLTYRRITKPMAWLPRWREFEGPTQTYAREATGTKSPSALSGPYPANVGMSESNLINPDDDILSFRRVVIVRRKTKHNHRLDPIMTERYIVDRAFEILLDMVDVSNDS